MMVRRIINSTMVVVLLALTGATMFQSCYYDVETNLVKHDTTIVYTDSGGNNNGCDTTNVSYVQVVQPMIQQYCIVCHSKAAQLGGVNLDGYNNVIVYVESGQFLGALNWEPGYTPMPKDAPQLDDCTLAKINAWVHQGASNN